VTAYYNEFDAGKAAWLRNLIEEGLIAHGIVDERSIEAVEPGDLAGFDQCHFFAGIGLWSLCLRRAGWPDDRPVWTGSCPCGPFSVAGKGLGFADPRHLWPQWFRLIRERRPVVLFGEQSDAAVEWIDLVSTDLEGFGYAVGSPDIPAAGFGGAHRRQRFGFVADADNAEWWSDRAPWRDGDWPKLGRVEITGDAGLDRQPRGLDDAGGGRHGTAHVEVWSGRSGPVVSGRPSGMGAADRDGSAEVGRYDGQVLGLQEAKRQSEFRAALSGRSGYPLRLAYADGDGCEPGAGWRSIRAEHDPQYGGGPDWLLCRDGLWRPVEPGTCPLVDADPGRMGRLRGYGDAIDVEAFASLIGAYLDCAPPERVAT
jgi:DNA (cytosine-5)-methyltransferase 1